MNSKSLIIKVLLTLFVSLSHGITHAEQWYHVEVIAFEQLNSSTDEQWPVLNSLPNASLTPSMATQLIQPAKTDTLNDSAQRLRQSSQYRVHYHRAWQQPIKRKYSAKAVKLSSPDSRISGSLKLYKGTYLFASVDLALNNSSQRTPNLVESRRIHSKKLHFFDHPKIGFLLQLTPIPMPTVIAKTQNLETYSLPNEATAIAAQ
jgi:hypothetical protein